MKKCVYTDSPSRVSRMRLRRSTKASTASSSTTLLTSWAKVRRMLTGTFSSVYKAIDIYHSSYKNTWTTPLGAKIAPRAPKMLGGGAVYVALKRIYVTSSVSRILNELEVLEALRDKPYVSYLISAFRTADQVILTLSLIHI